MLVSSALALAAMALAARLYGARRSEQAFATGVLCLLGVALPIHVLGWSGQLTTLNLAGSVVAEAAVATAAALWSLEQRGAFLLRAVVRTLSAPVVGLQIAWRTRSALGIGLLATMAVLVWTAWLSYLAPASGWDGLWYHDAIVGFSIQHHGFALEPTIPHWHQLVNHYARGSEYFNIYPVLLWDRRLIELAPSVFGAIALPGLYALFRRFELAPVRAIGLACGYILIPGFALQFRSTYIDAQVAVCYLAALYFVTQPELRVRDTVLGAFCIGLLCNAKSSGLPIALLMFGLFALRVIIRFRRAPVRTGCGLVAAALLVTAIGGPTYIRNYQLYKNPLYPLVVESERLDIHWQGPGVAELSSSYDEFKKDLLSPPWCDNEWPDTRTNGYGNGPPFIVLPCALLAVLGLLLHWAGVAYGRTPASPALINVSYIVGLSLAMTPISPTWTWARFNLHIVLGVFVLCAWWLGREREGQLGEGALSALVFASLLTLLWSRPGWGVPWDLALALRKLTPEQRATNQVVNFLIPEPTAIAREHELQEGDVIAVDWWIDFMAMAWNERYTNVLQLITPDDLPRAQAQLEASHPKWVVIRLGTALGNQVAADPASWQQVGPFRNEYLAYRRVAPWPVPVGR
ncbi:MAG: Nitrate/nitrite transporter [Myxococcaceae bacterium]|nr:Nitrate/nitrite transporter [Myxococcaceae bacterium]